MKEHIYIRLYKIFTRHGYSALINIIKIKNNRIQFELKITDTRKYYNKWYVFYSCKTKGILFVNKYSYDNAGKMDEIDGFYCLENMYNQQNFRTSKKNININSICLPFTEYEDE
jgi:hypothetical protein